MEKRADSEHFIRAMWDAYGDPALRDWVKSVDPDMVLGPWKPEGNIIDYLEGRDFNELRNQVMTSATSNDPAIMKILKGFNSMLGGEWGPAQEEQAKTIRGNISVAAPFLMRWAPDWWDEMHGSTGSQASLANAIAEANRHNPDFTAEDALRQADAMSKELLADPMSHRGFSLREIGQIYREASKRGLINRFSDTSELVNHLIPIIGATSAVRDSLGPEGYATNDIPGMFNALDTFSQTANYDFGAVERNIRIGRQLSLQGGHFGAAMSAAGQTIGGGGVDLATLEAQNRQLTQQAGRSDIGNMLAATARARDAGMIQPGSAASQFLDKAMAGTLDNFEMHDWRKMMSQSGVDMGTASMLVGQRAFNQDFIAKTPKYQQLAQTVRMHQTQFDHQTAFDRAGRQFANSPWKDELMKGEKTRLAKSWGYRNFKHYDQLQGRAAGQLKNVWDDADNRARVASNWSHLGWSGPVRRISDEVQRGTTSVKAVGAAALGAVRTPPTFPKGMIGKDDMDKDAASDYFMKTSGQVTHIAGPSGSGKTTLLNELLEQHPGLVGKDLDELDEDARVSLGLPLWHERDWSDEEQTQHTQRFQKLVDKFVADAKGPAVLAGYHFTGEDTLDIPADTRVQLDTSPLKSTVRQYRRNRRMAAEESNPHLSDPLYRFPQDWLANRHTAKDLKAQGYAPTSADDIRKHIASQMETKAAMDKEAIPGGLPDRKNFGDISDLKAGELSDIFVQRHKAQRAGEHYDYRIGTPETGLFSWATKPPRLPKPGERRFMKQQPIHTHQYGSFSGTIGSGYGKGEVRNELKGKVLIHKATPDKIEYTIASTGNPERFILMKPPGWQEHDWLLINNTRTKQTPYEKTHYKSIPASEVEPFIAQMREGTSAQAKIDGASSLIEFMRRGPEIMSYRVSKKTGNPIVHTERVFGGRPKVDIPKKYEGTVLKGEMYGQQGEDGKVLPAQQLGGLLNSTIENSLKKQKEEGIKIKNMVYDIQQLGKKHIDPEEVPYAERRKMLEEVMPFLPKDTFHLAEEAKTPEEASALWRQIVEGKHPLTHEGMVFHPPTGRPVKVKQMEDSDVHITDIFPGTGRLRGTAAGGFGYSLGPDGKRVGEVGTGLTDELRRQMWTDPESFVGRTARIHSQEQFPSGAWRSPALIALHEDYPSSG